MFIQKKEKILPSTPHPSQSLQDLLVLLKERQAGRHLPKKNTYNKTQISHLHHLQNKSIDTFLPYMNRMNIEPVYPSSLFLRSIQQTETLWKPQDSYMNETSMKRIVKDDIRHEIAIKMEPYDRYCLMPQCVSNGFFLYNVGDVLRMKLWNRSPHDWLYVYVLFCSAKGNMQTLFAKNGAKGNIPIKTVEDSFEPIEKDQYKEFFIRTDELPDTDLEARTNVILITTASKGADIRKRIADLRYPAYEGHSNFRTDDFVMIQNFVFFSSLEDRI